MSVIQRVSSSAVHQFSDSGGQQFSGSTADLDSGDSATSPPRDSATPQSAFRNTPRARSPQSTDWLAIALLILYVAVFSMLTIRQHNSFNSNALDMAKFDQSIWNTSRGRPYQITIAENLVIDSHFSPALAVYAPLYWIWPDIRVLFFMQSLLLGGAGFLIYWHFRRFAPWLGVIVFAAYLMHPLLHQVNLVEFRRVTLAVFAVSFAVYHLLRRQYGWMALGLLLALLSKEDMSVVVASFGLYILLVQRNWKVGGAALLAGIAWFFLVPFVILPQLMGTEGYQHAGSYYSYMGTDLPGILETVTTRPAVLWEYIGRPERLTAVFNMLWPTAFMFLLAPEFLLLLAPYLVLLLASTSDRMGRLDGWYPGVLLVILYWATGMGIDRLPLKWRRIALALLLLAGAAAWFSSSELWPGPRFDGTRYQISEHERQVAQILEGLPADAVVMAQDPLVPHISHRENIYLLPWVRGGNQPDYVLMDREMRTYPVGPDEYRTLFYDFLSDTSYEIAEQLGSFYIFEHVGLAAPEQPVDIRWPEGMHLSGVTTAAAAEGELFSADSRELPAGSTLRAELYWTAEADMAANYTVFVHAVDAGGRLLGQHDSWPADAHRPTSVLAPGEQFRDVHYLTLSDAVNLGDVTLRIGLYDSDSGEALFPEGDQDSAGQEAYITVPAVPGG